MYLVTYTYIYINNKMLLLYQYMIFKNILIFFYPNDQYTYIIKNKNIIQFSIIISFLAFV